MIQKIKNIMITILLITWMTTVFIFSSQDYYKTNQTSGQVIHIIESAIQTVQNNTNQLDTQIIDYKADKETLGYKYSTKLQTIVRKNAHYILYLIGGVILSAFFCAYVKNNDGFKVRMCKIFLCAFFAGSFYGLTDEFHQKNVPGRTYRLTDVGIDSLGVLTGSIIFVVLTCVLNKINDENRQEIKQLGEKTMTQPEEVQDFAMFTVETDVRVPEESNIVEFDKKNKILDTASSIKEKSYGFFKRAVDIAVSATALTLLSPVLIAAGIAVKKDSEGPALLRQERIGKDGKLFTMYKFRSMCLGADEKLEKLLAEDPAARLEYSVNKKLKNDPRITKVGGYLRKTSIDELPQLINVLKGDMSLVGPRPYLPREVEDMRGYYDTIVESKPGITGLWQVSGRSNTTFNERMEFDVEYNENKGFFYDMGLLTKTVSSVLKGDGAE